MHADSIANPTPTRTSLLWQLALLACLSASYEALFVYHGVSALDEGWPLYAVSRLLDGGVLYDDVLFVFPPGHLLPAWLGYQLDPPGIIATRVIDAALNVGLCLSIYLLGRRLMPAGYALLAGLLLAVAAPWSHMGHFLFGYRYLVFSTLALLAFAQRLDSGSRRWTFVAGALTGVALCFRLTPAFAVSCGVGIAIVSTSRRWRDWVLDWSAFALGLACIVAPVVAWFANSVGLATLWSEVVVRPMAMIAHQSLPFPELRMPASWTRVALSEWFTALQFRLYPLMYLGYWGVLGGLWLRAWRRREPFSHVLLLAVSVWGGVYFLRTQGRSDIGHLESAIPPACLLIAFSWHALLRQLGKRMPRSRTTTIQLAVGSLVLGCWIFLFGSDRYLRSEVRGIHPLQIPNATLWLPDPVIAQSLGQRVEAIRELSAPEKPIFDLSASPLLHLLADRPGLAHSGLIMPGTFADPEEERRIVAQLQDAPPELVIAPLWPFDSMPARSVSVTAPRVSRWVIRHYEAQNRARYPRVLSQRPRDSVSTEPSEGP